MANTSITRADALAYAIDACYDNPEVVKTLMRMYASITKPRSASAKVPSRARRENEKISYDLHALALRSDSVTFDTAWVVANDTRVRTPQKATAVMRVAVEMGLFRKVVTPHGSKNVITFEPLVNGQ